jgi:hypothetical protein
MPAAVRLCVKNGLRTPPACLTVNGAMLSMAPTTFALIHGSALCADVATWRPMKLRNDDTPSGV